MSQIKQGTILTYTIQFVQILIALLYTPILLRYLGQSEYGLYSLVLSIIGYLSILDLGFGNSIIRYTAKYKTLGDKHSEYKLNGMFLVIYSCIGLFTVILGIILYLNLEGIFSNSLTIEELNISKVLVIISVINLALSFPLSLFGSIIQAYEHFVFSKVVALLRTILNPVIMLPLLLLGHGSIALITVISVLNIGTLIVYMGYCFKQLHIKLHFKTWDFTILKEISAYSFYIFITLIVDRIYWSTDQIILGVINGTSEVSIYAIGAIFTTFFITFTSVISSLQLPKFTQLVTNGVSDKVISDEFIKLSRIQFMIGLYFYLGFLYIGKDFTILWAGDTYINSYYVAIIIMTALLFGVTQNSAAAVIQAKNMQKFKAIIQLIIAIVNVVITIPFAKKYGAIGAAIATFVSFFFGNRVILTIYYHKKVKLNMIELWKQLIKFIPSIFFILLFIVVTNFIMVSNTLLLLFAKGLVYSIIFAFFMYKWNMNHYEKMQLHSLLLKLKTIGVNKE